MPADYRLLVWTGEREKTLGGLKKSDLVMNAKGRIVSKRKSELARKLNNLSLGTKKAHKGKKGKVKKPKLQDINPLTGQPRDSKGLSEISIDNIILGKRNKKKKGKKAKVKQSLGDMLKLKKSKK